MAVFEQFPYTNFHELNLDNIIAKLKEMDVTIHEFIAVNSIKYADPLLWDITSQYEMNTVVLDNLGNAYLSVQPVPSGIALTRTEYWTNIGNFSGLYQDLKDAFTTADEGTGTVATAARSEYDLVWLADDLYQITAAMNPGDTYTPGTNCQAVNIQSLYAQLLADINALDAKIDAKTFYHIIDNQPIRTWAHINSQDDFEAFLAEYNTDTTSRGAYIDTAGQYYFPLGDNGVYPVFNGVQIHLCATVAGVELELNCATVYTSHLAIYGDTSAHRIKITNTQNTFENTRVFYCEGGTFVGKYLDIYGTMRFLGGTADFESCDWYDYNDWANTCLDSIVGAVVSLNSVGFLMSSFHTATDALIGIGEAGTISTLGRLSVKSPTATEGCLFLARRGTSPAVLYIGSSIYDPDLPGSYSSAHRGNFADFITNKQEQFIWFDQSNRLQYLVASSGTVLTAASKTNLSSVTLS